MQLRHRRDLRREKIAEASRLFRMAYALQVEGDLDRALTLYEKSIRLHPTAEALSYLAWAVACTERYDEAVEHCFEAMRLDPSFPNPWNDVGVYRIRQGRPAEALFFLKRAARLEGHASFAHYNLHRAYLDLGDRGRAMTHLHAALDEDADFLPAQDALTALLFPDSPSAEEPEDWSSALTGSPVLAPPL